MAVDSCGTRCPRVTGAILGLLPRLCFQSVCSASPSTQGFPLNVSTTLPSHPWPPAPPSPPRAASTCSHSARKLRSVSFFASVTRVSICASCREKASSVGILVIFVAALVRTSLLRRTQRNKYAMIGKHSKQAKGYIECTPNPQQNTSPTQSNIIQDHESKQQT